MATEAFQCQYPEKFGARVMVHLTNGDVLQASVSDAWGDPENALSESDLIAKARTLLSAAGMQGADVEALISASMGLWQTPDLSAWSQMWPQHPEHSLL